LLTLAELLKIALAHRAVGFTFQSGLQPVIRSSKGVQTYDTQPSTFEDVEAILRRLMSSRQMREFRAIGLIYFRSVFEGVVFLGAAKIEGEEIHVELRKLGA
jgi:Tfp pilus assembly pilus retraction ATPase PilT